MDSFVCPSCKTEKPRSAFGDLNRIRNKRCKECVAASVRKTYANSSSYRAATKSKNRRTLLQNQIYIFQYLASHPCVDCGENDPIVLEFDHIFPEEKQHNVTAMYAMSRKSIDLEISRCVIRCSNCHKKRTHRQLNSVRFQLCQNGIPEDIDVLISTPVPKAERIFPKIPRVKGQQHPEIECSFCHEMFVSTYTKMSKSKRGLDVYCTTKCSNASKSKTGKKQGIVNHIKNNPDMRYTDIAVEFGVTDVYVSTIARKVLGIRRNSKGAGQ